MFVVLGSGIVFIHWNSSYDYVLPLIDRFSMTDFSFDVQFCNDQSKTNITRIARTQQTVPNQTRTSDDQFRQKNIDRQQ